MLTTYERIITVQDLAQKAHTALTNAQQEPLVVTENGRPAAYLISVELFDRLMAHLEIRNDEELKTAIALGEEQFAQGQYKTLDEAVAIVEAAWKGLESPQ